MGVMEHPGRLIVTPHPVTLDGQTNVPCELRPGESLFAFLTRHIADLDGNAWEVTVAGVVIERHLWHDTYPKHGQVIEVRSAVGKTVLYLVAMVALIYFTFGFGTATAGMWGAGAVSTTYGAVAATAVYVGGSILINKVLGPKPPSLSAAGGVDSVYSITSARNTARPYEPVPLLFGSVQITPDLASNPYTFFEGNDQYLSLILNCGINVDRVDAIYNGDALLSSFEGVTTWKSGFSGMGEEPIPLYSNADSLAGGALASGVWIQRTTSADTIRMQVEVEYLLFDTDDKGRPRYNYETLKVEYRAVGATTWLDFGQYAVASSLPKVQRKSYGKDVAPGQYEVQVRRLGLDTQGTRTTAEFTWSTLTSVQADPATYAGLSRIGVKVRATGQLSGALDELRMLAIAKAIPYWNGSAWLTDGTGISNPGAQMLYYARGIFDAAGKRIAGIGLDDAQIDIEAFKAFTLHCAANGYRYDGYLRQARSHDEMLASLALSGFGQHTWASGRLSVAWAAADQPLSGVVNMATIKRGQFQVDYTLANAADGIEFTYLDRTDWATKTLRVTAPGITTMLNPAQVSGEGVTTEAHAAEMARYHLAQSLYQYKDISYSTDLEHLSYRRLSVLALQHDLTQWGYGGRVMAAVDAAGTVTLTLDEAVPPPATGNAWIGLRIPGETAYRVFQVAPFGVDTNTITLVDPWPVDAALPGATGDNPAHDTIWIYDFKQTPGYRVRVVGITPEDGLKGASVSVVPESAEFWTYVKTGAYTPPVNQSLLQTRPVASNASVTEARVAQGNTVFTELSVSFGISGNMDHALIFAALGAGDMVQVAQTFTRSATWRISAAGTYTIVVRPYSVDGIAGGVTTAVFTTGTTDIPPANFDDFTVTEVGGGLRRYAWSYNSTTTQPADLAGAEIRYIAGPNAAPSWAAMTAIGEGYHAAAFESEAPVAGIWTFAIRARNTSGTLSTGMLLLNKTLANNIGQVITDIAVGAAAAASAAATAQAAADLAQAAANTANSAITIISSDAWLSKAEKPSVMREHQAITAMLAGIQASATSFAVSQTAHTAALNSLNTYLGGLTPAWNSTTTETAIVTATFNTKFGDYYAARQALLDAIAAKAKSLADAAQGAATAAQAAAAAAQLSADAANADLANISSDALLTPDEKPRVIRDRDEITNGQAGIDAQATAYGVTTEKTAYDSAITALTTYLATLTSPVLWSALTGTTTIVGATFRAKFLDAYSARTVLLQKIADYAGAAGAATASGSNLAPNPSFASNLMGLGTAGITTAGPPIIDGWQVTNVTGAGSSAQWRGATGASIRLVVGNPTIAAGAYAAAQVGTLYPIAVTGSSTYSLSFTGVQGWNGVVPTGVTVNFRAFIRWLDNAGVQVGADAMVLWPRGSSPVPAPLNVVAPATARTCHVFLDVFVQNTTGGALVATSATVALYVDVGSVSLVKVANFDTEVEDGPIFGRPLKARLAAGRPWVDLGEYENLGRNLGNMADTTTRFAAVESGANNTETRTAADFTGRGYFARLNAVALSDAAITGKNLDNIADSATYRRAGAGYVDTSGRVSQMWDDETGVPRTGGYVGGGASRARTGLGTDGRLVAGFNDGDKIAESATRKWAGESGANITETRQSAGAPWAGLTARPTDAALLNINQTWVQVSGTGRPADNATADLALVARGTCAVSGNVASKPTGAAAWDADVYSIDSYTGGAYASAVPAQTTKSIMFGLNADPLADSSFASIDYALYPRSDGILLIYESGANISSFGAYAAGDVLAVIYDGSTVRYLQNGTVLRTIAAAADLRLFFDSAFSSVGGVLRNLRFGPMTDINAAVLPGQSITRLIDRTLDNFADTPTYGRTSQTDLVSNRIALSIVGSGARLGSLRNAPNLAMAGQGANFSGLSVTYTSASGTPATATISATAFTQQQGGGSEDIAYSARTAAVSGTGGTTVVYYLYHDDPTYAGGSPTLVATTTKSTLYGALGRVYLAAVSIPFPTTGTGSGGSTTCVVESSYIGGAERAGDLRADGLLPSLDPYTGIYGLALITYRNRVQVPCLRLTSARGIVLECSASAELPARSGRVRADASLGVEVWTEADDVGLWEPITRIEDIGVQWVIHVSAGESWFRAGKVRGRYMAHHNGKPPPP